MLIAIIQEAVTYQDFQTMRMQLTIFIRKIALVMHGVALYQLQAIEHSYKNSYLTKFYIQDPRASKLYTILKTLDNALMELISTDLNRKFTERECLHALASYLNETTASIGYGSSSKAIVLDALSAQIAVEPLLITNAETQSQQIQSERFRSSSA